MGECTMVSVPPMCTMATFFNLWLLPPQYVDFEDSQPAPLECPTVPAGLKAIEPSTDFSIVSAAGEDILSSPYGATRAAQLPIA